MAGHRVRTLRWASGMALGALVLSGCTPVQVARPERPDVEPYTRAPLQEGQASRFVSDYSKSLNEALAEDGEGLEKIQDNPLLDRTRAEAKIAKANDKTLSAAALSSVVAGGPSFDKYPMWFVGFAASAQKGQGSQVMTVVRESASDPWKVSQSMFVSTDEVPKLRAEQDGSVPAAADSFGSLMNSSANQLSEELASGKAAAKPAAEQSGGAVKSFRSYVDGFAKGENAFKNVTTKCSPRPDDSGLKALATADDGGVALGQVNCTTSFSVPNDYAVNMGKAVKAVMTTAADGKKIEISTVIPFMVVQSGGSATMVTSDWFLKSAKTSKS